MWHYETNPPKYDQALTKKEVKLEIKLAKNSQILVLF
jgi:hypothetical protein